MITDAGQRLRAAVNELRDLIVGFVIPPVLTSLRRFIILIVFTTDPIQERSGPVRGPGTVECRRGNKSGHNR